MISVISVIHIYIFIYFGKHKHFWKTISRSSMETLHVINVISTRHLWQTTSRSNMVQRYCIGSCQWEGKKAKIQKDKEKWRKTFTDVDIGIDIDNSCHCGTDSFLCGCCNSCNVLSSKELWYHGKRLAGSGQVFNEVWQHCKL